MPVGNSIDTRAGPDPGLRAPGSEVSGTGMMTGADDWSGASADGGTTIAKRARRRPCRICSVDASSTLPASRQISARLRRPSSRNKTFHSSGVRVAVCFTRSGFTTISTARARSGNTSDSRERTSMRRTPSISRFCSAISSVTAVCGGGTRS